MPDKVFETLLVIDGRPVEAEGHIHRLRNASGVDATDFLASAAAGLSSYHRLRIDFVPPDSLTATPKSIPKPSLFSGEFTRLKLVSKQLEGSRLNAGYGEYKIADRAELEELEAQTSPALPLLIDGLEYILETTRHNVFVVEGDRLIAPPLDGRILPGVTRKVVLNEARKLDVTCHEEPIHLDRAKAADGMFVTNAIIGIGWVEQCDDIEWLDAPFLIQKLHSMLADKWQTNKP